MRVSSTKRRHCECYSSNSVSIGAVSTVGWGSVWTGRSGGACWMGWLQFEQFQSPGTARVPQWMQYLLAVGFVTRSSAGRSSGVAAASTRRGSSWRLSFTSWRGIDSAVESRPRFGGCPDGVGPFARRGGPTISGTAEMPSSRAATAKKVSQSTGGTPGPRFARAHRSSAALSASSLPRTP